MLIQMNLRLVEYPPSTRAVGALVERTDQLAAQKRRCSGVARPWARVGRQPARDDLADQVFRQIEKILVVRWTMFQDVPLLRPSQRGPRTPGGASRSRSNPSLP